MPRWTLASSLLLLDGMKANNSLPSAALDEGKVVEFYRDNIKVFYPSTAGGNMLVHFHAE
jgi:hypothetical protein